MLDFCAGTSSTAKVCTLLDPHGKFVRCSVGSELLTAAEADLAVAFACQVLKPKSDIRRSEEVRAAATVFRKKIRALLASTKAVCGKSRLGSMLSKSCRAMFCSSSQLCSKVTSRTIGAAPSVKTSGLWRVKDGCIRRTQKLFDTRVRPAWGMYSMKHGLSRESPQLAAPLP